MKAGCRAGEGRKKGGDSWSNLAGRVLRLRDGPELHHLLPLGGVIIFAAVGMVVELLRKIHAGGRLNSGSGVEGEMVL
jgi:hypothetical protein